MKIQRLLTDQTILAELGARLTRQRLDQGLTQAQLAKQAGISKRTLERVESGHSSQMSTLIRILRVLDLMDALDALVPEAGLRPMELIRLQGKTRRRASGARRSSSRNPESS